MPRTFWYSIASGAQNASDQITDLWNKHTNISTLDVISSSKKFSEDFIAGSKKISEDVISGSKELSNEAAKGWGLCKNESISTWDADDYKYCADKLWDYLKYNVYFWIVVGVLVVILCFGRIYSCILVCLGFTAKGPAKSSCASCCMSLCHPIRKGSVYAAAQSAAMRG